MTNKEIQNITLESLRDWFKKEKWVRISSSGNIAGPCGTSKNKKNPDRCLPKAKAQSLSKGERAATAAKKKKAGAKGKTVVKNTKKATVKEIGDLSQTPYKFTKLPSSKSSPYSYYKFITDNGTTYEVVFEREETDIATTYHMAFTAKGKEGDSFSSSALTGENEPLKIMSTVADITKKHLDKVDDADYLKFEPTKGKEGEAGNSNTRAKLYKLIVKKNFPKLEVIADDDTVLIDLEGYYGDAKLESMKKENISGDTRAEAIKLKADLKQLKVNHVSAMKKVVDKRGWENPGAVYYRVDFTLKGHEDRATKEEHIEVLKKLNIPEGWSIFWMDSRLYLFKGQDGPTPLQWITSKDLDSTAEPIKESLWANINAKKKAGKKSSHKNSNAYKDAKKSGDALKKETKEAPAGHYFTKSGNLVKGRMSADAKERGARKSDPKDKQRSKVPKATQYSEMTKEDVKNLIVGTIAELKNENTIMEKDDRCTRLAKQKYDTWPSAYASGAVVRCRRGEIWKKK